MFLHFPYFSILPLPTWDPEGVEWKQKYQSLGGVSEKHKTQGPIPEKQIPLARFP